MHFLEIPRTKKRKSLEVWRLRCVDCPNINEKTRRALAAAHAVMLVPQNVLTVKMTREAFLMRRFQPALQPAPVQALQPALLNC